MINATSLDYQNNMEQVEQMPKRLPILIIDDEPVAINLLEDFVKKINYLELEASYSALQFLEQHEVDILITDVQMPDINGLDFGKITYISPGYYFCFCTQGLCCRWF